MLVAVCVVPPDGADLEKRIFFKRVVVLSLPLLSSFDILTLFFLSLRKSLQLPFFDQRRVLVRSDGVGSEIQPRV